MIASYAARIDPENPLKGLELGEVPEPSVPHGWTTVRLRAASLNHHDLWSLRGVGLSEESLPKILGCDGAGEDAEGNAVVIHSVIGESGHGIEPDEERSMLSERYPGTFAERIAVPRWNLLPMPPELGFEEAACLPGAWLTAYRMLFTNAELRPGDTVLVQGAGGGVATAAVVLGSAAGFRVFVTSRDDVKRKRAVALGAEAAFEVGARLPQRVDAVLETVGAATWSHSVRALKNGGRLVISGATSGPNPPLGELQHIFYRELRVIGSTMGTKKELAALLDFCVAKGVRPIVDSVFPMRQIHRAFARMERGDLFGKIVLTIP
ncbi:zinc-binding dehydrogenase [Streptomyces sp. 8N616]|uniref:zinc-binding dehydrogenase n=1 Tax=Streptomyces sp. 8N616 TaxID=3457414 RepID=UPI003FD61772